MNGRLAVGFLSVVAALAAIWWLSRDILPPKSLVFAAGIEGGGYWQAAEGYRDILAEDGIAVEILATAGALENAALLRDGRADAAILQGGVPAGAGVESLGAIFNEPIFVFTRADGAVPANPGAWTGMTIAAGGDGSGTRAAFDGLLQAAGVPTGAVTPAPLGGAAAAEALSSGTVDAAFFVAPITAPYLGALLASPETVFLDLAYLPALSRRIEGATLTRLPAGALALLPPVPRQDRALLVTVAQLGARSDLHPSLVDRLVTAAERLHRRADAVTDAGTYPSATEDGPRMDAYARRLIENGPSALGDYLPYWVVAQINRFAILALPVLFLLLPLLRLLPTLYSWRVRSRVFRYYADIQDIDAAVPAAQDKAALDALDARLLAIDRALAALKLPLPYRDYAQTARLHVDLVRSRVRTGRGATDD